MDSHLHGGCFVGLWGNSFARHPYWHARSGGRFAEIVLVCVGLAGTAFRARYRPTLSCRYGLSEGRFVGSDRRSSSAERLGRIRPRESTRGQGLSVGIPTGSRRSASRCGHGCPRGARSAVCGFLGRWAPAARSRRQGVAALRAWRAEARSTGGSDLSPTGPWRAARWWCRAETGPASVGLGEIGEVSRNHALG